MFLQTPWRTTDRANHAGRPPGANLDVRCVRRGLRFCWRGIPRKPPTRPTTQTSSPSSPCCPD